MQKKGDVDMVLLLVENMSTEEINQPGFGGCTPLHIAVFHGFLPVVSVLASHGASLIVSSKHSEAKTDKKNCRVSVFMVCQLIFWRFLVK